MVEGARAAWRCQAARHAAASFNLIGAAALARLPRGAILINTARGGIVDEAALVAALDSGHLAWAGLDVFAREPLPEDSALRRHPRVFASPHLAANTPRSVAAMGCAAAESIIAVLAGRTPNFPGSLVLHGGLAAVQAPAA